MNLDRLNTLNLRLTLARRFGFAACWFKRPLSVFKRSGFLRMSGAEFAAMKTMNFDRLTTLNLRLTLQDVFSAPCRFKRPLSVFKRSGLLRMSGAEFAAIKTMNIDRLTTLNLRLTLQDVFSAPCRFKRPLSVFKRWEFLRKRRETEAMNIDRLNTLI